MSAVRGWTCRKCKRKNEPRKKLCVCGTLRPPKRQPAHKKVLTVPYEDWVQRFGEECGICGKPPMSRRLDRDHDHHTGGMRGLLCHRCNRALPAWIDADWLGKAKAYLERAAS